jgi:hypothetical protein
MLVAFFLALVCGFAGAFRDKHKALSLVVMLVSGIVDAYLLCRIFT